MLDIPRLKDLMLNDPQAFLREVTAQSHAPACPEVKLWLATEITPLWEATEAALDGLNVPPPYWAFCWAGGQALTRHVLDNPHLCLGKRVLDFAAGCGITGIAAAMGGAKQVDAAEIDFMAVAAIRANAALNGVTVDILDQDTVGADCRWDVVVAGDVCYEKPMTEYIFPWLRKLAAQGATVLMADPGRAYLPKTGLMQVNSMTVPTSLELEDRTQRDVVIYQIVG